MIFVATKKNTFYKRIKNLIYFEEKELQIYIPDVFTIITITYSAECLASVAPTQEIMFPSSS